ncbi:hypothetical protein BAY61_09650 [Prauserella marina]|uniref:DUF2795 domain-containing protein n=1 Tax=Prauserella marina TaxID=530584 RepID=A0A222VZB1_9PSEU|nr:DUF2795 domain-containing protein [Prauserella marina]ASR39132.1 hypothetical protein BAY61_09650 [Prauserella marina]PWV85025.1 uncharacterized protein DUF2795 [Prauserella marina]SDC06556.1 Protein of unknown function [Prauserella marina]
MPTTTTAERVRAALSDADFPAEKPDLMRCAEKTGADRNTVAALGAMPPVLYENLTEVMRSVPLDQGDSAAEEAPRRREHDKPGLAQREKDISGHPIIDELGENRGS